MRGNISVGADDGEAYRVLGEPLPQMAFKVLDDLSSQVSCGALAAACARVDDHDEAGAELVEVVALGVAEVLGRVCAEADHGEPGAERVVETHGMPVSVFNPGLNDHAAYGRFPATFV